MTNSPDSPGTLPANAEITAELGNARRAVLRKVTWRLIPFLFLCYILSYLDRVNVSFAKLQMQHDLGMTEKMYGTGMGIFFIGYFLWEVPSNLMLQKLGARRWIGPIMIVWGLVSSATMFAKTPALFYSLRFLLGTIESGFFPGVVLYLTFWFPRTHLAKTISMFMSAIALAGAFGSPFSGWIMGRIGNTGGLANWQWLFLLEGIPSALVGMVALWYLDDGPKSAKWLDEDERKILSDAMAEEEALKRAQGDSRHSIADAFKSPKVWWFCLVYFGVVVANYFVGFWMPEIIKRGVTADPWQIGLVSIIPWGFGACAMIWCGHHSDVTGERRWHLTTALLVAAFFLLLSGIPGVPPVLGIAVLAFAVAGIMASISTFWSLPTAMLSGSAAAAGVAWINSVGNLGGFVSPYAVGWIRDHTSNPLYPALLVSASCLMAAAAVLVSTREAPNAKINRT
ncbi:MAG: MFS transporter [Chthoniobacter sp.]|uniref:MFS transporter n=1 Tax=Chthoniobacter sp. TaxID=2510640 RepID=UPI0032A6AB46